MVSHVEGPPFPTHCFANIHSSFATIYTLTDADYRHIRHAAATSLPPPHCCRHLTVAVARKPWLIPRPYILIGGNFGVLMGERSAAKIFDSVFDSVFR
jgi:hypothetical protein